MKNWIEEKSANSSVSHFTKVISYTLLVVSCASISVSSAADDSGALLLGVTTNGDLLVTESGSSSPSYVRDLNISSSQGIRGSGIR